MAPDERSGPGAVDPARGDVVHRRVRGLRRHRHRRRALGVDVRRPARPGCLRSGVFLPRRGGTPRARRPGWPEPAVAADSAAANPIRERPRTGTCARTGRRSGAHPSRGRAPASRESPPQASRLPFFWVRGRLDRRADALPILFPGTVGYGGRPPGSLSRCRSSRSPPRSRSGGVTPGGSSRRRAERLRRRRRRQTRRGRARVDLGIRLLPRTCPTRSPTSSTTCSRPCFPGISPTGGAASSSIPGGRARLVSLAPVRAVLVGVALLGVSPDRRAAAARGRRVRASCAPRSPGTPTLNDTGRGAGDAALLFICASLPLYLGARGARRLPHGAAESSSRRSPSSAPRSSSLRSRSAPSPTRCATPPSPASRSRRLTAAAPSP